MANNRIKDLIVSILHESSGCDMPGTDTWGNEIGGMFASDAPTTDSWGNPINKREAHRDLIDNVEGENKRPFKTVVKKSPGSKLYNRLRMDYDQLRKAFKDSNYDANDPNFKRALNIGNTLSVKNLKTGEVTEVPTENLSLKGHPLSGNFNKFIVKDSSTGETLGTAAFGNSLYKPSLSDKEKETVKSLIPSVNIDNLEWKDLDKLSGLIGKSKYRV